MANEKAEREQQLQTKMMQFQVLQNTHQNLRQQLEQAVTKANEIAQTKSTLELLGDTKPADALLPIGCDNFVPGRIEKADKVVISIGGNAVLKKPRADAIRILDGKLEELQKHVNRLSQQLSAVESDLVRLQPQIEAMLQER